MKGQINLLFLGLILIACNQKKAEDEIQRETESKKAEIAKTIEENYVILDDSLLFNGGTIENFDLRGNSIDVYWIGKERDTTLRFYRKYDDDKNLIGAEYFRREI